MMPAPVEFLAFFKRMIAVKPHIKIGLKEPTTPLAVIRCELEMEARTKGSQNIRAQLVEEELILKQVKACLHKVNASAARSGLRFLKGNQVGLPSSRVFWSVLQKEHIVNFPQDDLKNLQKAHDWLMSRQVLAPEIMEKMEAEQNKTLRSLLGK